MPQVYIKNNLENVEQLFGLLKNIAYSQKDLMEKENEPKRFFLLSRSQCIILMIWLFFIVLIGFFVFGNGFSLQDFIVSAGLAGISGLKIRHHFSNAKPRKPPWETLRQNIISGKAGRR